MSSQIRYMNREREPLLSCPYNDLALLCNARCVCCIQTSYILAHISIIPHGTYKYVRCALSVDVERESRPSSDQQRRQQRQRILQFIWQAESVVCALCFIRALCVRGEAQSHSSTTATERAASFKRNGEECSDKFVFYTNNFDCFFHRHRRSDKRFALVILCDEKLLFFWRFHIYFLVCCTAVNCVIRKTTGKSRRMTS